MRIVEINNRNVWVESPRNFNGKVVIFFHGACSRVPDVLNDRSISDLRNKLLSQGFVIVYPEAREDFCKGQTYYPRFEPETNLNADVGLVNSIIHDIGKVLYENFFSRLWFTLFGDTPKYYVMGGSSGGMMASRMANSRVDLSGMVVVNSINCNGAVIEGDKLTFTPDSLQVAPFHCKTLMVSSINDAIFRYEDKVRYAAALGDKCTHLIEAGGEHNWSSWTVKYHDDIMKFLKD
jgi:hypothetical protein